MTSSTSETSETAETAAPAAHITRFTYIHASFHGLTRSNHVAQFGLDDLPFFVTGSDLRLDRCQCACTARGSPCGARAAGTESRTLRLWKLELLAFHFRPLGLLFGGQRSQDLVLRAKTFQEVLDFRLLSRCEIKLLGNLGAVQRCQSLALEPQLTEPFSLLRTENLGSLYVGLPVGLFNLLGSFGETLIAILLAQVLHLTEVAERRPDLLLRFPLEVAQIGFLRLAEPEFLLDRGDSQQHQAGSLHPSGPKTRATKTRPTGPREARTAGTGTELTVVGLTGLAPRSGWLSSTLSISSRRARRTIIINRPSIGRHRRELVAGGLFARRRRCEVHRLALQLGNGRKTDQAQDYEKKN